jgi:cell division protein FtsA
MSLLVKTTKPFHNDVFTALDIGSSKICCAIGQIFRPSAQEKNSSTATIKILSAVQQVSRGVRQHHIVNMQALEDSILSVVHQAEQQAGQTVNRIYVSLPSIYLGSSYCITECNLGPHSVEAAHTKKLLALGQNHIPSNKDQQLIHVLPLEYALDNNHGILDPKGMVGDKLQAYLHLISVKNSHIINLNKCISRCRLEVAGYVCNTYAGGISTLVEDELSLGATLIDLGGGSTSIGCFFDHQLIYQTAIPLGGNHVTADIARGLAVNIDHAERLKTLYGNAFESPQDDKESILINQIGEENSTYANQIPKGRLTNIIRCRVEEIFEMVRDSLQNHHVNPLCVQRFIITGGGSQLQSIKEIAQSILKKPVRIASPKGLCGTSELIYLPGFSVTAGLLYFAQQDYYDRKNFALAHKQSSWWQRFQNWVKQDISTT